jgi:hypothetical protein
MNVSDLGRRDLYRRLTEVVTSHVCTMREVMSRLSYRLGHLTGFPG